MKLELSALLAAEWQGKDPFVEVNRLEGEDFRRVKTRRTFRFELDGRGFFAKVHHGVGYREIFKNLSQFKRPVISAATEREAIRVLTENHIPTMTVSGFGEKGWNPARLESFLITEELVDMTSLEDVGKLWAAEPPNWRLRRKLLVALAETAGAMHRAGVNHRDCYLCHFLWDRNVENPRLFVIDLHRAQCRKAVPHRYLVKDVAGLYFSSMDLNLSRREVLRFIRHYANRPLREELRSRANFYAQVERSARKLYFKEFGRVAPKLR